ncbi:Zf-FLZ domain - like 4 [Theobroma cacao]|uniref:Uncharacterized protein LOC18611608 n=1 Tax=Theobroma cacao TaxID=3641 RepID=A0AB32VM14_THECC|nr:PREDICTED: uncharacterized protein LOC18611608 [Theobroma cacao]WRX09953.1 Zf-FLZ domain - like 4 [Theobroma cacao]
MLLGKRSRHPIKRTTSMTGITVDVSNVEDVQEPLIISDPPPPQDPLHEFPNGNFAGYDQRFLAMVSPRNPAAGRSGSTNHVVDTAPFLRSCCLCKRRLAPSRDIYMYRGDTAFCSSECREQQMKQDERKEKLKGVASKKEERHASSASSKASTKTEPVAAA